MIKIRFLRKSLEEGESFLTDKFRSVTMRDNIFKFDKLEYQKGTYYLMWTRRNG
jgi:hypothetical protein